MNLSGASGVGGELVSGKLDGFGFVRWVYVK